MSPSPFSASPSPGVCSGVRVCGQLVGASRLLSRAVTGAYGSHGVLGLASLQAPGLLTGRSTFGLQSAMSDADGSVLIPPTSAIGAHGWRASNVAVHSDGRFDRH